MVDPVWAGVVGALGGAVVGSLTSLFTPLIGWRVERKRLEFEREQRTQDRNRATIAEWRRGLDTTRREFVQWQTDVQAANARGETSGEFTVDGRAWFEELRPFLEVDPANYSYGYYLAQSDTEVLASEIARIEQEWNLVPKRPTPRREHA